MEKGKCKFSHDIYRDDDVNGGDSNKDDSKAVKRVNLAGWKCEGPLRDCGDAAEENCDCWCGRENL
jgi:hypothetical protein